MNLIWVDVHALQPWPRRVTSVQESVSGVSPKRAAKVVRVDHGVGRCRLKYHTLAEGHHGLSMVQDHVGVELGHVVIILARVKDGPSLAKAIQAGFNLGQQRAVLGPEALWNDVERLFAGVHEPQAADSNPARFL